MLRRAAIAAILRSFRTPRAIRSLRRVLDLIEDLRAWAEGRPIMAETVRIALEVA
jgi:hypothetical protein